MEEVHRYNIKQLKDKRRELRRNQTIEESILWQCLRGKNLNGFKFYRQYSIGPYIVDFYCPRYRLAIEIDGSHHKEEETIKYDEERDNYFKSINVYTVRFWNDDIRSNLEATLSQILSKVSKLETPLS